MNENAEYELREAQAEIARHHKLIVELRDGLSWALGLIHWVDTRSDYEDSMGGCLYGDDEHKYDHYLQVLNRQVS